MTLETSVKKRSKDDSHCASATTANCRMVVVWSGFGGQDSSHRMLIGCLLSKLVSSPAELNTVACARRFQIARDRKVAIII